MEFQPYDLYVAPSCVWTLHLYKKLRTDSRHQGNHNAILSSIFVLAASVAFTKLPPAQPIGTHMYLEPRLRRRRGPSQLQSGSTR